MCTDNNIVFMIVADENTCSRIGTKQILSSVDNLQFIEVSNFLDLEQKIIKNMSSLILVSSNLLSDKDIQQRFLDLLDNQKKQNFILSLENIGLSISISFLNDVMSNANCSLISKSESEDTYVHVVQAALTGSVAFSPDVLQRKRNFIDQGVNNELTKKELEILHYLAKDLTNSEIGINLDISVKSVEKHLSVIYEKLHVNTRVGAVVWYVTHNYELFKL